MHRQSIMDGLKHLFELFKLAGISWQKRDSSSQGAAITCYAIFSIAPLLLFTVVVISWWFGEEAARGQIVEKIDWIAGAEGAAVIQSVIQQAGQKDKSLPLLVSLVVMLFGASGVFVQFQAALNKIWGVKASRRHALLEMIERRLISCVVVFAIGMLILSSLVLTVWFSAANQLINSHLGSLSFGKSMFPPGVFVNAAVSLTMFVVMFALIFKCLPDFPPRWRDVWVGAITTSVLFLLVKQVIGSYLGKTLFGSSLGAAESVTALTTWIYLSSLIVLFGAEIVHANDVLRKERRIARKLQKIEDARQKFMMEDSDMHENMVESLEETDLEENPKKSQT